MGNRALTKGGRSKPDDDGESRALPPGAMSDNKGLICRTDAIGRLYEVDEDGVGVTKRGTTRPKSFGDGWWPKGKQERKA